MPYIPHTGDDVKQMLAKIGAASIEDLWSSVPDRIRLKKRLDLPGALAESELFGMISALAGENLHAGKLHCLLGGGTYHHYIPPAVDQLLSRSEFYTSYTPYQPEVSQGTLQAIFEFQTMICELSGMEVANASMYDGAEAAAEAVLMAERIMPKNEEGPVVVAGSLNPLYRRTIATYTAHSGREIIEAGYDRTGTIDLEGLEKAAEGALAVVVQHPNYFGCLERMDKVAAICAAKEAVFIAVVTEPLAMAMLEPPGAMGADIVAAEGQSLGIPMGMGGPHLGLFACREQHMRKMPGRLTGQTVDSDGRRGYVLTLATREQHIRRAKATSNICTNQGLLALASSIYMSLLGPRGLKELARINRARTEYLKQKLQQETKVKTPFSSPTFNEFVIDLGRPPGPVLEKMIDHGFLAGIPLGGDYPGLENAILVAVTEMTGKEELDRYAQTLGRVLGEA